MWMMFDLRVELYITRFNDRDGKRLAGKRKEEEALMRKEPSTTNTFRYGCSLPTLGLEESFNARQ